MTKHKHKRAKTRVHLVTGIYVDVQEDYDIVRDILSLATEYWVNLTLENGDPVAFHRNWIAYITKH